jgi:putative hydrolase of the HAD superfamily
VTNAPQADPKAARAAFAHVDTWVFDLDNTLYPPGSDLWPKIDARMTVFLCDLFGIDGLSARALQKHYYRQYGTTLRGLVEEHRVSAEDFLAFVHDIDRSSLPPDPSLAAAIAALPGRRLILTNGSRRHAVATAKQLGIDHLFEDVFDIIAAGLLPKPHAETYETFFDAHGVDPARAAMFEDIVHNLEAPAARGMKTVLVVPRADAADHREEWERHDALPAHVDFVTDDLTAFLEELRRPALDIRT